MPGEDDEKSDEDDDDEDDARMRYHLRPPSHHRRHRSSQKSMPQETTTETVPTPHTPRLTRLGARHESGHDLEEDVEQEQLHPNRHLEKSAGELNQLHGRRSRSATSSSSQDSQVAKSKVQTGTYSPSGSHVTPRKIKKKTPDHHEVPSLPPSRRRLRARTTKVAKMGIDEGKGACDDDEEDEEEEEEEEEEDEEEVVDYDAYTRNDPDEEMQDVGKPSPKLQARQATSEDASAFHDSADGFIASKPEVPMTVGGLNYYLSQQTIHHAKRKVEDEDMEDAPSLSTDEGQVVSTKLARIDETSDGDRNAYLKTFYNILKSPRGDDDEGILSSESEDADLESEDDDDDFEEIDVWEFIATLPPLGPLPQNFIFTMPERTASTPPITLVLDIDETLVHCATRPLDSPDIVFPVEYNQETWEVYGRIRPGMYEFLEKMSTKFEVITFTASQECYAEALLKIIDPEKKFIKHRYYRDSCVPVFGNYVKDLRILNRDLSKVVIVDNSPQAFGYQISNGVPIESWYDDKSDRELAKLMDFLETLHGVDDVRPMIDMHYKLHERIHKTVTLANHHQISSMSGLGNLGATLIPPSGSTSNVGSSDPTSTLNILGMATSHPGTSNQGEMDATMLYDMEKPSSPSDEDNEREEEEEEKSQRELRSRKKGVVTGEGSASTMTTRSNSQALDAATNLAKISL